MVVSPHPQATMRSTKPLELQKLDKVHKVGIVYALYAESLVAMASLLQFWPILKSTMSTTDPDETELGLLGRMCCADLIPHLANGLVLQMGSNMRI